MKLKMPTSVTRTVAKHSMKVRKNAPSILFVGGVAGVVTSTVLACRATLKLNDVLEKPKNNLETANSLLQGYHPEMITGTYDYSEKDYNQDRLKICIDAAWQVTKLYGPSVVIGVGSVCMLTKSHNILNRRNAGLTAAYAALEKGYSDYRKRVVNELGEDKDKEFQHGTETSTTVKEDKNGPKKVKKKHFGPDGTSPYAKFFNAGNVNWDTNPDYNIMFLRNQQNYANQQLHAKGYLFLSDVYDVLGFERTKASQVVGWVLGNGDDYVDFGVFSDKNMVQFYEFVSGKEGELLLDFNVDGTILDKF